MTEAATQTAATSAATSAATTDTTAAPTAAAPTAAATTAGTWYDSFADADLKGWLAHKGLQNPQDMAVSYRNLEKLIGNKQAVELPNWDDAAATRQFMERLGLPKTADEYDLPAGDTVDETFTKWARATLHEVGIPSRQAKTLVEKFVGMEQQRVAERAEQSNARIQTDVDALKKEWGAAFAANTAIVDLAAEKFGLSPQDLEGLRNALGPKRAMTVLHNIGSRLGEDRLVVGDAGTSFGALTPTQAQGKITQLRGDADFIRRYTSGDMKAREEMERLHRFAYPEG